MKKKVYYAHPVSLYGTKQEQRDLESLAAMGFEILNPNTEEHTINYEKVTVGADGVRDFNYFINLARTCDVCAFRAFPDGSISSGVAKEIEVFVLDKKPYFELPTGIIRRTLSIEHTKEVLRDSGAR